MGKNVGLITYHSAFNFGSMLQAFATQQAINRLGHNCSIINYRIPKQREYYSLFRLNFGLRKSVADVLMLPSYRERKEASNRFEDFIRQRLNVTVECDDPLDAINQMHQFETLVSGSDQIWNKHSFEMESSNWSYMLPYLLADCDAKKISYASSVGGASDVELNKIAPYLNRFDHISVRETQTKKRLESILCRKVEKVLDPTFLLHRNDWIENLGLTNTNDSPYVLYYSLRGYRFNLKRISILKDFAKKRGCRLLVFTPTMYIPSLSNDTDFIYNFGPKEFLNTLFNANCVVSESYHGTILAINFEKDVFSICGEGGAEFRKSDILTTLGLDDRIINNVASLSREYKHIDYETVNATLERMRNESLNYLCNVLE